MSKVRKTLLEMLSYKSCNFKNFEIIFKTNKDLNKSLFYIFIIENRQTNKLKIKKKNKL